MEKIEISFSHGIPRDITIDDHPALDIDAFLLLTHRNSVEEGHFLAFGNSEKIGQMLYNLYLNCVREQAAEMGHVLELVARDILDLARAARGPRWSGDPTPAETRKSEKWN